MDSHHLQVIMLQENLAMGHQIPSKLKVLLPGWYFTCLDANESSGGLPHWLEHKLSTMCQLLVYFSWIE